MKYRRTALRPEKPDQKITYLSEYWDLFCEIADIIDEGKEIDWETSIFRLKVHDYGAYIGELDEDVLRLGMICLASLKKESIKNPIDIPGEVVFRILGKEEIDEEQMIYLMQQAQEHIVMRVPKKDIE